MAYCVVITTVAKRSDAEKLAENIIDKGLAACVQLNSIDSYYKWQGKLNADAEVRLMIKTRDEKYKQLEEYIAAHHPYDVPQIIKLPVTGGFKPYLNWIDETTL